MDATLRVQLRTELIELHRRVGTTFIYVTHDQVEAMSMGTDIILLEKGFIRQNANPATLYAKPTNTFSAKFIGTPPMNVIPRKNLTHPFSEEFDSIGFRPELTSIALSEKEIPDGAFRQKGELVTHEMLGAETLYKVRIRDGYANVKLYVDKNIPYGEVFVYTDLKNIFYFAENGKVI